MAARSIDCEALGMIRQHLVLRRLLPLVLVVAALVGPTIAASASTVTTAVSTGGPAKGLFIQLSSWSWGPAALTDWMNYICQTHRDPAQPGYIRDLVLQDVATPDPNASPTQNPPVANDQLLGADIDALLPYFPGGNGPCQFDNVFVGTVDLQAAAPDPYRTGIQDPNRRWNVLLRSRTVADAFAAHVQSSANPSVIFHWYVTYEAMLNYFTDSSVEQGYLAFMLEYIHQLSAVAGGKAFLWSPGFDQLPTDYPVGSPSRTQLQSTLQSFFSQLKAQAAAYDSYGSTSGGPLWLDLQDHVGSMDCYVTPMTAVDAATWFSFLGSLTTFTSLRMNVEQFRHQDPASCTSPLVAADPAEVTNREAYYGSQGIVLGAAWELRFWGDNNHA
jgi:hypothetical protein